MQIQDMIQLADSLKRSLISLVILWMAYQVTMTESVPKEYGGIWIGFAGLIVGFYFGSKTGQSEKT